MPGNFSSCASASRSGRHLRYAASNFSSAASRPSWRRYSTFRAVSPGKLSRAANLFGPGKACSLRPWTSTVGPSSLAMRFLIFAAWTIRMRWPMSAHAAASYGEEKQTALKPRYRACNLPTTESRCPTSGNALPSASSESMSSTCLLTTPPRPRPRPHRGSHLPPPARIPPPHPRHRRRRKPHVNAPPHSPHKPQGQTPPETSRSPQKNKARQTATRNVPQPSPLLSDRFISTPLLYQHPDNHKGFLWMWRGGLV